MQWAASIGNRSINSLVALYDPDAGQFFGSLTEAGSAAGSAGAALP